MIGDLGRDAVRRSFDTKVLRGVEVGDIRFADFTDPDGNRWALQERGFRDQPGSAGA